MLSAKLQSLHERALSCAELYREAHAKLLDVILEVDSCRLFQAFGLASTYAYCREQLKLSEDVACSFIAVARKCRQVPELKKAVDDGLPFTNALKASRVITKENQAGLLALAKTSSSRELEREIVKEHPREAVVERVRPVAEDRHKVELGLSDELLKKLRRAQDLVSNKTRKAASLEETLAALLEPYLEKEDPVHKAERARAASAPNLQADKIPAAILHQVNTRDQGRCQHPGCGATRWVEVHHRRPRAEGGDHSLNNLITLCPSHHRQAHHPSRHGSELNEVYSIEINNAPRKHVTVY